MKIILTIKVDKPEHWRWAMLTDSLLYAARKITFRRGHSGFLPATDYDHYSNGDASFTMEITEG